MAQQVVQNIKVGRHSVTLTPFAGGTAKVIGLTKDGTTLSIKKAKEKIMCHELGTPIKEIFSATDVALKLTLVQYDLDLLAFALGATKTTVTGPPDKVSVDVSPVAGGSPPLFKVVLHPIDQGAVLTSDVTIWCMSMDVEQELGFRVDKELNLVLSGTALATIDSADVTKVYPVVTVGDVLTAVSYTV